MVDGARIKWCIPLMLDAILYLSQHYTFDLSKRRSFNQHRVLFQCIWEAILESLSASYSATSHDAALQIQTFQTLLDYRQECHSFLPVKASRSQSSNDHEFPLGLDDVTIMSSHPHRLLHQMYGSRRQWLQLDMVSSLPSPWQDLQHLRDSILANEPNTKSHRKFHRILQQLCGHACWEGRQSDTAFITSVYERAICHALLYFHSSSPSCPYASPLSTSTAGSVAPDIEGALEEVLPRLSGYHRDIFVQTILPQITWFHPTSATSTTTSLPSPSPTTPPRKKQRVNRADGTLAAIVAHELPSPSATVASDPTSTLRTASPSAVVPNDQSHTAPS